MDSWGNGSSKSLGQQTQPGCLFVNPSGKHPSSLFPSPSPLLSQLFLFTLLFLLFIFGLLLLSFPSLFFGFLVGFFWRSRLRFTFLFSIFYAFAFLRSFLASFASRILFGLPFLLGLSMKCNHCDHGRSLPLNWGSKISRSSKTNGVV